MQKKTLIKIYDKQLHNIEEQVNSKLSTGKYELINIIYASTSTFSTDYETEDGWYAFMIDNN